MRAIRTSLELGQKEFATKLGYKRPETVSDWENGRKRPSMGARKKMAQLARRSYEEVWGDCGEDQGERIGIREQRADYEPQVQGDDGSDWRLELEAANRRARALELLARAEEIHAEASRLRASALAAQSEAAKHDSARANGGRAPVLFTVEDLLADRVDPKLRALILDRLREQEPNRDVRGEDEEREPSEEKTG